MINFGNEYIPENPIQFRALVMVTVIVLVLTLGATGVYAFSHPVSKRFALNRVNLEAWEQEMQSKSFYFVYRLALLAIPAVAALSWIKLHFSGSKSLEETVINIEITYNLASFIFPVMYAYMLLPILYLAWALRPISAED